MNIENINNLHFKCFGCEACFNICPVNAIQINANAEGFNIPIVQKSCVNCEKCLAVCPILVDKSTTAKDKTFLWAHSNDDAIRMQSSSGGIFTEVAKFVFSKDGVVVGAGFDENMILAHKIAENERELVMLRGSKYVQSNKSKIFTRVKQILEQGRIVAFFGTPCEIHGLKNFLGKEFENLLTIDFVCHGVPSPMMFKNSLNIIEKRLGHKIINFTFREKINGWRKQTAIMYFSK